jgi:hypothetical protein
MAEQKIPSTNPRTANPTQSVLPFMTPSLPLKIAPTYTFFT